MEDEVAKHRILQLISADGWYAAYVEDDPPKASLSKLCAWALVEDSGGPNYRSVRGLDGDVHADDYIDFCDNASNFLRYVYVMPGATGPDIAAIAASLEPQALEWLANKKQEAK